MSDTRTDSVTELEELLDNEIPCGGVKERRCPRDCDKAAVLMGHGHGCPGRGSRSTPFKCITCWQAWFTVMTSVIARRGFILCGLCHQHFADVESFSDYRPF